MVKKIYEIIVCFADFGDEFDTFIIKAKNEKKAIEIAKQKILDQLNFSIFSEFPERKGWCYIHNEEKDCYNEDGDHDDYHCRKCEKGVCPRCKNVLSVHTALSRRDNKTKICSLCGNDEAMFDLNIYLFDDEKEKKVLIEKEKKWLNN